MSPVLILISGDIDFVNDLRGYQTRLGCTIVLIHAPNCSMQLKIGWNEVIVTYMLLCSDELTCYLFRFIVSLISVLL